MREHNSEFIIRDGIVLIASVDEMFEWGSEIRYYDCQDLVQDIPTELLEKAVTDEEPPPTKRFSKELQLTNLIQSTIPQGHWEEEGQSVGIFNGVMVVNNSAKVHDQVEELLAKIREITSADPK